MLPSQPMDKLVPPRSTADGTHRRLLGVALKLFGQFGFHGVSVRDIARAAKIHPSSMYTHLQSKDALLLELILLGHEEHLERLEKAMADAGARADERLAAVVRAHVGM